MQADRESLQSRLEEVAEEMALKVVTYTATRGALESLGLGFP